MEKHPVISSPRVAIGMFVHNEEKHLQEAVDSLLNQTYSDFRLIILDDCSTDGTFAMLKQYEEKDARVVVSRNTVRNGYIANYRRSFQLCGKVDYFAWAAGHDRYHPRWLEKSVKELNKDSTLVGVYPRAVRISDSGDLLPEYHPRFQTVGMSSWQRVKEMTLRGEGYGNMIYGLFRAQVIHQVGIFRPVLLPDVCFMCEISLYGAVKQIPEVLWYRRYAGLFSLSRQRRIAFAHTPWYAYLPWPIVNAGILFWCTGIGNRDRSVSRRALGAWLSLLFFLRFFPKPQRHSRIVGPVVRQWLHLSSWFGLAKNSS